MSTNSNKYVLIVAGGKGKRMESELPKQFLTVANKPILMHTIESFWRVNQSFMFILVLPQDDLLLWKDLCKQYNFTIPHTIVQGGNERFYSVKNGLAQIPEDVLVAVHDGVRPFVSKDTIDRTFKAAAIYGNAIPVIDVHDSIRELINENTSKVVNRCSYRLVQTPQVFNSNLLKKAYHQPFSTAFTDDASVVEAIGEPIYLVDGNRENTKITSPLDLDWASFLLSKK